MSLLAFTKAVQLITTNKKIPNYKRSRKIDSDLDNRSTPIKKLLDLLEPSTPLYNQTTLKNSRREQSQPAKTNSKILGFSSKAKSIRNRCQFCMKVINGSEKDLTYSQKRGYNDICSNCDTCQSFQLKSKEVLLSP